MQQQLKTVGVGETMHDVRQGNLHSTDEQYWSFAVVRREQWQQPGVSFIAHCVLC